MCMVTTLLSEHTTHDCAWRYSSNSWACLFADQSIPEVARACLRWSFSSEKDDHCWRSSRGQATRALSIPRSVILMRQSHTSAAPKGHDAQQAVSTAGKTGLVTSGPGLSAEPETGKAWTFDATATKEAKASEKEPGHLSMLRQAAKEPVHTLSPPSTFYPTYPPSNASPGESLEPLTDPSFELKGQQPSPATPPLLFRKAAPAPDPPLTGADTHRSSLVSPCTEASVSPEQLPLRDAGVNVSGNKGVSGKSTRVVEERGDESSALLKSQRSRDAEFVRCGTFTMVQMTLSPHSMFMLYS
jgi:hypothetical protein